MISLHVNTRQRNLNITFLMSRFQNVIQQFYMKLFLLLQERKEFNFAGNDLANSKVCFRIEYQLRRQ